MASGVPCVAADAGGIPDLIEEGVTGYLCKPGDATAFAEKISLLLENTQLRAQMSLAARAETEKHSWESATSYLRNVQYKQAITHFKSRSRAFQGSNMPQMRATKALIMQLKRCVSLSLSLCVYAHDTS